MTGESGSSQIPSVPRVRNAKTWAREKREREAEGRHAAAFCLRAKTHPTVQFQSRPPTALGEKVTDGFPE
jgi:hypothetical protein